AVKRVRRCSAETSTCDEVVCAVFLRSGEDLVTQSLFDSLATISSLPSYRYNTAGETVAHPTCGVARCSFPKRLGKAVAQPCRNSSAVTVNRSWISKACDPASTTPIRNDG